MVSKYSIYNFLFRRITRFFGFAFLIAFVKLIFCGGCSFVLQRQLSGIYSTLTYSPAKRL